MWKQIQLLVRGGGGLEEDWSGYSNAGMMDGLAVTQHPAKSYNAPLGGAQYC